MRPIPKAPPARVFSSVCAFVCLYSGLYIQSEWRLPARRTELTGYDRDEAGQVVIDEALSFARSGGGDAMDLLSTVRVQRQAGLRRLLRKWGRISQVWGQVSRNKPPELPFTYV